MKYKIIMFINSVLAVLTGMVCMIIPRMVLNTYDVTLSEMGIVIYQFWGTSLFGLGLLSWFLKNITEFNLQKKIVTAFFITNGLSCLIAVRGQFAGANIIGWSTVAIYFMLSVLFGLIFFIKNKTD